MKYSPGIVLGLTALGLAAASFIVQPVMPDLTFPANFARPILFVIAVLSLLVEVCVAGYRRLNRPPPAPFFSLSPTGHLYLELDADGSYESCVQFLHQLQAEFGAEFSEHMEAGARPLADKDKGYWNVRIRGEDCFVMRDRGSGIAFWGPKGPADATVFLQIAEYYQATRFELWPQRLFKRQTTRSR